MKKYSDIDMKLSEFGSGLAALAQEVRALQAVQPPVPSRMTADPDARHDINISSADRAAIDSVVPTRAVNFAGSSAEIETGSFVGNNQSAIARNWASMCSTPALRDNGNRYDVLRSTDDDDFSDATVVQSRRNKRRNRQSSSPQQQQQQQARQFQPAQQLQQQRATDQTTRTNVVLGKSANTSRKVAAAKQIKKKAVFCIDNVHKNCSVDDIRSFVSGLSVTVLTCFEVKSRRRRGEDEADIAQRKAFRLCICDDDRARLLDDCMARLYRDIRMVFQTAATTTTSTATTDREAAATHTEFTGSRGFSKQTYNKCRSTSLFWYRWVR